MKKNLPLFYNKKPIDFIEKFDKIKVSGKIKSNAKSINGVEDVIFKRENNEFSFEFDELKLNVKKNTYDLGNIIKKGSFLSGKLHLKFENLFLGNFVKGFTSNIYEKSFSKSKLQYFKFIIPLENKINFNYQLAPFFYKDEFSDWSSVGFSIEAEDEKIFVQQKEIKKGQTQKCYLIFESNKKQAFREFSKKIFALRVSLGYIIGNFAGNRGYFFSYGNIERKNFNSFCFETQRGEIKNFMQPINRNPYAWLTTRNKRKAEYIYKKYKLRTLSIAEFSKLYKITLENDDFLAILLLMLESSESSLLLRPGGYSIILESLSSIIVGREDEKLNPIISKAEAKKFRTELLEVLKSYENNKFFKDNKTLKVRLDNINQVTNKEKLVLPFKILKINLLDEDIKIINSRNDFLHGRIPDYRNLGLDRNINEKDRDMYYASVRFYTIINMLILKFIGYDGYVLNFSKIFEKETTYIVREDYYRKVCD